MTFHSRAEPSPVDGKGKHGRSRNTRDGACLQHDVTCESVRLGNRVFKCDHTSVRRYDTSDDVTILMFDPKSPSQE